MEYQGKVTPPIFLMYALLCDRWEKSRPATVDNLILVTGGEAEEHDAGGVDVLKLRDPELYARITSVLALVSESFGVSVQGS